MKTDDEGLEFVKCRPVARDFKPRRDGPRDDSFAAMPPLESKKHCSLTKREFVRRDVNKVKKR